MKWLLGLGAVVLTVALLYTDLDIPFVDRIKGYIESSNALTLEARYTPDQIMEEHKRELLGKEGKTFLEPGLTFYPYLLLDVKYDDGSTKEGIILWSLVDGEMVINADSWEKTHGFQDALTASTTATEFKVLNALYEKGGSLSKEKIQKALHIENDNLDQILTSLQKKHLITQKGPDVKLHFQDPKFPSTPETKISEWLVTKPFPHAQRESDKYSKSQIEKLAKAAFGDDFNIRSTKKVFLPVITLQVQNPDGSFLTSYWNSINGKRITTR